MWCALISNHACEGQGWSSSVKNGNQWVITAKAAKTTRAGDESTQHLCYFLLPRFFIARIVINCYATGVYKA